MQTGQSVRNLQRNPEPGRLAANPVRAFPDCNPPFLVPGSRASSVGQGAETGNAVKPDGTAQIGGNSRVSRKGALHIKLPGQASRAPYSHIAGTAGQVGVVLPLSGNSLPRSTNGDMPDTASLLLDIDHAVLWGVTTMARAWCVALPLRCAEDGHHPST